MVSTTVGAYGIPLFEPHGLIRRDDAQAFSSACIELLLNRDHKAQKSAANGSEIVQHEFDWKRIQSMVAHLASSAK